ncbi:MAG: class I SAM-dependent methyltransferase, partial [Gemmatimonadota bacterium]|nr:class I SAM-dependent methyltransferase [Gemmatimonadota bacterium]
GNTGRMNELLQGLNQCRLAVGTVAWREECKRAIVSHPVRELLHLEPLTKRAFEKPYGLVADAVMMDMAFSNPLPHSMRATLAQRLYRWMMEQKLASGLRSRRSLLAQAIDRVAAHAEISAELAGDLWRDTGTGTPSRPVRVLAVSGGHLRELTLSLAVIGDMVEEVVALDNHRPTLNTLEALYKWQSVSGYNCSIASVIDNSLNIGAFDFIYVPELLHFLPDTTAAKLTRNLFARLRPGGQLMLMNFAPTLPDIGYMECVMQWYWTYRDAPALRALTTGIAETQIAGYAESIDATGNLSVLGVIRSSAAIQIA